MCLSLPSSLSRCLETSHPCPKWTIDVQNCSDSRIDIMSLSVLQGVQASDLVQNWRSLGLSCTKRRHQEPCTHPIGQQVSGQDFWSHSGLQSHFGGEVHTGSSQVSCCTLITYSDAEELRWAPCTRQCSSGHICFKYACTDFVQLLTVCFPVGHLDIFSSLGRCHQRHPSLRDLQVSSQNSFHTLDGKC